jgi:hypothetical protein
MKSQTSAFLLLLGMMMVASVNSEIPDAAENPFCPATGTDNLAIQSTTLFAYDLEGSYFDS